MDFQKTTHLDELKKKLRSRIRSIERLTDQLVDQQLLGSGVEGKEKAVYISRILQKLREEVDLLDRPELIDGRHARAIKQLRRLGYTDAVTFLERSRSVIAQHSGITKTAQTAPSRGLDTAIRAIRQEINDLSYTKHLHTLYEVLTFLDERGRGSEVDIVAKVIRDELPGLENITKKLTDVFTALGRLPLEKT